MYSIAYGLLIDYNALAAGDFDMHFIERAKKLHDAMEVSMGMQVPNRASEEVVKRFEAALESESDE